MSSRLKTGFRIPNNEAFKDGELPKAAVRLPRLWMILLLLALPFFIVSTGYFESLERTGPIGAFIADTTFSGLLVGYFVVLYALKLRRI